MARKKRLVIFGNIKNCDIAKSLLDGENFYMVGGIVDTSVDKKSQNAQRSFLVDNNLAEVNLDSLDTIEPDFGMIISYGRIIPEKYLSKFPILNLHGGLLPKWRGLNANCWAIINGEQEIGYTLHRINAKLDEGPIYYKFKTRIAEDEKFEEAKVRIHKMVIKDANRIISKIISAEIREAPQQDESHIYTTLLRPEFGLIKDWGITTSYLYNLYRVFGAPYGSGIYFTYKSKKYEITKMSKRKNITDYIGIVGTVVLIDGESALVKTGDNVISLDELKHEGFLIKPSSVFRIGHIIIPPPSYELIAYYRKGIWFWIHLLLWSKNSFCWFKAYSKIISEILYLRRSKGIF
jgi:methionyl-tRNA formyltransferase